MLVNMQQQQHQHHVMIVMAVQQQQQVEHGDVVLVMLVNMQMAVIHHVPNVQLVISVVQVHLNVHHVLLVNTIPNLECHIVIGVQLVHIQHQQHPQYVIPVKQEHSLILVKLNVLIVQLDHHHHLDHQHVTIVMLVNMDLKVV